MTPMERIRKAHVAIMMHNKFCAFSGLLACGDTKVTDEIPTACTNGWDTLYNPDFVTSLNDKQLRLLILHEQTHKAYKHITVWKHLWAKSPQLANIAADHFVNLSLMDTDNNEGFVEMPSIGVQPDAKYRGWSVEQIFNDLLENGEQGEGGGSGEGEGEGLDEHDWENGKGGQPSEAEQAQRAQEIDRALRNGQMIAKKRGASGSGGGEMFGELTRPQIDWKQALREFVQETCQGNDESTWRRPNRRYMAQDIYMPSSVSERVGELVVGFDTSGSCFTGTVINKFVSELQAIFDSVKPEAVRVVCWDTSVCSDETMRPEDFNAPTVRVSGGGGTCGEVLFDYLREKRAEPQAIIQFTDGYVGDFGHSHIPTLWVITDKSIKAPWGQTLHISI
jgi:predicted metal-dependent peptidase